MGDEQLVEAIAKTLRDSFYPEGHPVGKMMWPGGKDFWLKQGRAVLPFIQAETEACAKVAEELPLQVPDAHASIFGHANDIAAAIRSRTMGVDR